MPDPIQQEQEREDEELSYHDKISQASQRTWAENPDGPKSLLFQDQIDSNRLRRAELGQDAEEADNKAQNRSWGRKLYEGTLEPALRGVTKAVDETSDFVVGLGAGIQKITGAYKLGDEEYEQSFLHWYQQGDNRANPLKFGQGVRDRYLGGPSDSLWESLLEGGVQFGVGFLGAGKLMAVTKLGKLGGAAHGAKSLKTATSFGQTAKFKDFIKTNPGWVEGVKFGLREFAYESVRGGVADLTVFDAQEGRLADLMEQYPILHNPIQQYLTTDEDDSMFGGRMKNLLEGFMLGGQIDLLLAATKGVRAARFAKKFAEAGDDVGVRSAADSYIEALEEGMEAESLLDMGSKEVGEVIGRSGVLPNADGTADVVVNLSELEIGKIKKGAPEVGVRDDPDFMSKLDEAGVKADDMPFDSSSLTDSVLGQRYKAAVADPQNPGKHFLGTSHEEAIADMALRNVMDRIGASAGDEAIDAAVRVEHEHLMDTLPRLGDGFVEVTDEGKFFSREEMTRRANSLTQEGQLRLSFDSPDAANRAAAAIEFLHEARARQFGAARGELDDETIKGFLEVAESIEESFKKGRTQDILKIIDETGINLKFVHNNVRAKTTIAAGARYFEDVFAKTPMTERQMRREAGKMFHGVSGREVMDGLRTLYGDTSDLAARMMSMRAHLVGWGNHARKLAAIVEGTDGDELAHDIAMARLADVMDQMIDMQLLVQGTASNVARGLRSQAFSMGAKGLRQARKANKKGQKAVSKIEDASTAVAAAKENVARQSKAGDTEAKALADKVLDKTLGALEDAIRRNTDSGLEGARVGEGVSAETLPGRAVGEGEPPKVRPQEVLTQEERIEQAIAAANDFVAKEADRAGKLRMQESLESPLAPAERVSVHSMSKEEIGYLTRMVFLSGNDDPAKVLAQMMVPSYKELATDAAKFIHSPDLTGFQKAVAAVKFWRTNMLLSGPRTNMINMSSNLLTSLSRPLELAAGGALHGNKQTVREGVDLLIGLHMHYAEAWGAMTKAFVEGQGILDPSRSHLRYSVGNLAERWAGGFVDKAVAITGMPGRTLMAADEFASQMNYRAHLRASLMRQGREAGHAGEALSEWVAGHMEFGFGARGQGVIEKASQFARENTFKADLGDKGQAFEAFVRKSDVAQLVMPFRKTPLNIAKYAWERFPGLNLSSREFRDAYLGRGTVRQQEEAMGKMAVGVAAYTSALTMGASGMLTGGGPKNKRERDLWLAAGNTPYTLRVGSLTLDIRRLDPIVTPLALMADVAAVGGELDDETHSELIAAAVTSMAGAISDRTFFAGLTEFMEAMTTGDEAKMRTWMTKFAVSTAVPSLIRQTNPDESFRDARTMFDEFTKGIWWMSEEIEPRRNVFGDAVQRPQFYANRVLNPMTFRYDDPKAGTEQARELYDIGASLSSPAPIKSFGSGPTASQLDLRERGKWQSVREGAPKDQSPYDRWMQLMGSKLIGDRSLKTRLFNQMQTQTWKDADPAVKRKMAAATIVSQRDVAWAKIVSEYPSLLQEIVFRQAMAGMESGTSDPDQLQALRDNFGLDERGRHEIRRDQGQGFFGNAASFVVGGFKK